MKPPLRFHLFIVYSLLGFASASSAAEPGAIALWPGAAPGSENLALTEKITERSTDPSRPDRICTRIATPSLAVHRPAQPNGVAVIVAPGGSYERVVVDKEGSDTAAWLNRLGVTAFVLKYRLPGEGHANGHNVPLMDAQRAMRLVRARAAEFAVDPARIGFLGYSAGGHLAMSLTFFHDRKLREPADAIDVVSARPDFTVLCYAAASRPGEPPAALDTLPPRERIGWEYRPSLRPPGALPPAFLFHAADDPAVDPQQSISAFTAFQQSGVPAEMHIFRAGGHGFGIRNAKGPVAAWPNLCEAWMRSIGVLK